MRYFLVVLRQVTVSLYRELWVGWLYSHEISPFTSKVLIPISFPMVVFLVGVCAVG